MPQKMPLEDRPLQVVVATILLFFVVVGNGDEIFYNWHVAVDTTVKPAAVDQPVITINGMFPGPLINATTDDNIHIHVFNDMDEPLLFTWNGIQQRRDSWQDGVSGTNCPILPGKSWTYVFQVKDQIGSFSYFPSINFQKAGGGYGPIRVNNQIDISVPFAKPEADFDLLIGDWYQYSYKDLRSMMKNSFMAYYNPPSMMLINGKGPYLDPSTESYESLTVTKGKTYRFRISNVGTTLSFNFRIQNHTMLLVETEGSYTKQITLDSLDVHVGQSYSVLVTANQEASDYYFVASAKMVSGPKYYLTGIGVLHYDTSTAEAIGPIPSGPDPFNVQFSVDQAESIRWNLTTGAARPNPQGTFNVTNVTLSQTFILRGSRAEIHGAPHYTVNDVSYFTMDTPLKLADLYVNGSGVYELDKYSTNSSNGQAFQGVFVSSGDHKGWIELVFKSDLDMVDAWHLDGFGFYVVGFGNGEWTTESRRSYNLYDPVVRSTVQVYPFGWTAVYAYLDNPGMWNVRSQSLRNWYLGQELYLRVYDPDPNPAKERPPPNNLLLCGKFSNLAPAPSPGAPTPDPKPKPHSLASSKQIEWYHIAVICVAILCTGKQCAGCNV